MSIISYGPFGRGEEGKFHKEIESSCCRTQVITDPVMLPCFHNTYHAKCVIENVKQTIKKRIRKFEFFFSVKTFPCNLCHSDAPLGEIVHNKKFKQVVDYWKNDLKRSKTLTLSYIVNEMKVDEKRGKNNLSVFEYLRAKEGTPLFDQRKWTPMKEIKFAFHTIYYGSTAMIATVALHLLQLFGMISNENFDQWSERFFVERLFPLYSEYHGMPNGP